MYLFLILFTRGLTRNPTQSSALIKKGRKHNILLLMKFQNILWIYDKKI